MPPSERRIIAVARRGAVRVDGERVEDRAREMPAGSSHVYQVGKRRFARVTLT